MNWLQRALRQFAERTVETERAMQQRYGHVQIGPLTPRGLDKRWDTRLGPTTVYRVERNPAKEG